MRIPRSLLPALLALSLFALPRSVLAAPPHTGIRGDASVWYPAYCIWTPSGPVCIPSVQRMVDINFNIHAQNGRLVQPVTTTNAAFNISLPPGNYLLHAGPFILEDGRVLLMPPLQVNVKPRQFSTINLVYIVPVPDT